MVLDRRQLPEDPAELTAALAAVRCRHQSDRWAGAMKIALISPSANPLYDLDYRFVQCLDPHWNRLDLRGNCGHSMLVAITAATRMGWVPLYPGARVRVNVINNDDLVVGEVDQLSQRVAEFTVHLLSTRPRPVAGLLPTGAPLTTLRTPLGRLEVSFVDWANPYVLVAAADLGVTDQAALFAADTDLLERLRVVRECAAEVLGWAPDGAFPKIAALGQYRPGELAVRAVTVPSWHPSLGLTGACCLAVAAEVGGTVPAILRDRAGMGLGELVLCTPGGTVRASAALVDGAVGWASVSGKTVRFEEARAPQTIEVS
ncbi:PrpF domain-containing protein [Actinophytocola sp. NPDC049390]|uniref:PrpF domain-containing protein n=1 Tax=Actinophytocola sp. NPDC049390 TaxID=3363894 RepID=UPI0037A3DF29